MFLTPRDTKPSLRILLWVIGICSIGMPILSYIFLRSFKHPGPGLYLALSWYGILKGYVWQLFTYILLHSVGVSISIGLFISVAFHLFILWFAGNELSYRFGAKGFWLFFLSSTLIGGIAALLGMFLLSPSGVMFGSGPPVFALLTIWVMCFPDMQMALFFVLRMRAKWLALIVIGISLFMHLSYGEWGILFAEVATIIWAYIVGRWIWKLPHPYSRRAY